MFCLRGPWKGEAHMRASHSLHVSLLPDITPWAARLFPEHKCPYSSPSSSSRGKPGDAGAAADGRLWTEALPRARGGEGEEGEGAGHASGSGANAVCKTTVCQSLQWSLFPLSKHTVVTFCTFPHILKNSSVAPGLHKDS